MKAPALLSASLFLGLTLAPAQVAEVELRLQSILVPQFEVDGASLAEAVDQLRAASKKHDSSERHGSAKGVRFAIGRDRMKVAPLLTFEMRDATVGEIAERIAKASGSQIVVGASGATFLKAPIAGGGLLSRIYFVPAYHDHDPTDTEPVTSAVKILESNGVTFPEGASAKFNRKLGQLIVTNTPENIDLIEAFLGMFDDHPPVQIRIRAEVFRIPTTKALALARDATRDRPDAEILAEIDSMLAAGDASLVGSPSTTTRSGQRARVESGTEVSLVTGYREKEGKDIPQWDTVFLGSVLEVDPVLAADGVTVDLNLALTLTDGEAAMGEREVTLPASGRKVSVQSPPPAAKIVTAVTSLDGQSLYLGSLGAASTAQPGTSLVTFVTADVLRLGSALDPEPE